MGSYMLTVITSIWRQHAIFVVKPKVLSFINVFAFPCVLNKKPLTMECDGVFEKFSDEFTLKI